jgi:hypothetical protein
MMLKLIEQLKGKDIMRATFEMLDCDQMVDKADPSLITDPESDYCWAH